MLGKALPPVLIFTFALTPAIAKAIFASWMCVYYEYDVELGSQHSYLLADPRMQCSVVDEFGVHTHSTEHQQLVQYATAFVLIWPVGVPILYMALLWHARREILHRRPNVFSRLLVFLFKEYRPECFYWEPVEMVRPRPLQPPPTHTTTFCPLTPRLA